MSAVSWSAKPSNIKMLPRDSNAGGAWSEKGTERIEGARTIECLRGRLLAERAATKLARHESQLMENKMIELENKLSQETKFKNKAEKKLTLLLNKLQSMKTNYVVDDSDDDCRSHVSIATEEAEKHRPKESITAGSSSENAAAEVITGSRSVSSDCSEDASSTITTNSETDAQNGSVEKLLHPKSELSFDGADDDDQHAILNLSKLQLAQNFCRTDELKSSKEEHEHDAGSGNSLVAVLQTSSSSENLDGDRKMSDYSGTVAEALNALRHAKEEIERSMERRRMIKVRRAQLNI